MSLSTRKNKRNSDIELTGPPNVAKIHYLLESRDDLIGMSHETLRYGKDYVRSSIYPIKGSSTYGFMGQLLTPVKVFFMDRIQHHPVGSDFLGYVRDGKTHIVLSLDPLTGRTISNFMTDLERAEQKTQKGRSLRRGRRRKV
jgi:hypothetical protein